MPLTPDLSELLQRVLESRIADIWTTLGGVVVAFDPVAVTADVRPTVRRLIPSDDDPDADLGEDLPILPNVPVCYPESSSGVVRFPLAPGDPVIVSVLTWCHDQYRLTAEVPSDPGDNRTHHLGNVICSPGFYPDKTRAPLAVPNGIEITAPIGPVVITANTRARVITPQARIESADVRIGIDAETDTLDKPIAIAELVAGELSSLASAVSAAVGAASAPVGGGPLTGFALTYTPGNVAATRVTAR